MEEIGAEEFDNIEVPIKASEPEVVSLGDNPSDAEIAALLDGMSRPAEEMKKNAVAVKTFLDVQIKKDMAEKGFLTDFTRRWMKDYNDLLKELQKALYGDKSTNLHLHAISHSTIASKMRKFKKAPEAVKPSGQSSTEVEE